MKVSGRIQLEEQKQAGGGGSTVFVCSARPNCSNIVPGCMPLGNGEATHLLLSVKSGTCNCQREAGCVCLGRFHKE